MNIIFVLPLVLCLFDLSVIARLRENLNVLVPNNDVNLHAKIKTLLNGDEVDPEDFSDNEIESLNALKTQKIEILRSKSIIKTNKIFDDVNKNIESNQIDRDELSPNAELVRISDDLRSSQTKFSGAPTNPSNNNTEPVGSSLTPSPTLPMNSTLTSTFATLSFTGPTMPNSTHPSSPHFSTDQTPSGTTVNHTTPWPITDPSPTLPHTRNDSSTPSWDSTPITPTLTWIRPTEPQENSTRPPIIVDNFNIDECLLGKAERYLPWLTETGGLNTAFILSQFEENVRMVDASRIANNSAEFDVYTRNESFSNLRFLSASNNNLDRVPVNVIFSSHTSLEFLSLSGNKFGLTSLHWDFSMPNLKTLDLQNCQIQKLDRNSFSVLTSLENLFLSNNEILELSGEIFPSSLVHLDLSYNDDDDPLSGGMKIMPQALKNLNRLQLLDLSFTNIERSFLSLSFLPSSLKSLSVCKTELPDIRSKFLNGSQFLSHLDISGNVRLSLDESMFTTFADSLEVLFARNLTVQNLNWTKTLKSLRILDLFNNNIHTVTNTSFSHLTNLTTLNLERNSIGNWYNRLFTENQHLKTLNLRENKLQLLTNDMKKDLSSVRFLAIGNNGFECTCVLQEFMHDLFAATRNANVTGFHREKEKFEDVSEEEFTEMIVHDKTRVSLGVRSHFRPEYDVISRTYQKYYQMAEQSVQALRERSLDVSASRSLNSQLITKSQNERSKNDESFETILFDYDEEGDDYKCMNVAVRRQQPIIDLVDLCEKNIVERNVIMILWISIPTVMIISALMMIIYWKWWYIKYFLVLCKNSAILTFMDEDSGKETIIKGVNDEPVEIFPYDVFVSYCEQNREWVLDEFIPNVERRESINVCLHERDFQVGYGILENIVTCMDRSRCLLLLVSEQFLLSQWCQFEMNLAQHRLLETRREKLILVLLEDIPARKQPKTLKYLMKTKTYIKWPENGTAEEKQLFWKRLKKSIISSKWETDSYGSIV